MKLYLSSYKIGDDTESFKELVGKADARVAVIDNSRDYSDDLERKANSLQSEFLALSDLGFMPEHLDLKNYFGKPQALVSTLQNFDAVWVVGGNSFVLRKAMQQSGFDSVIEQLIIPNKLVYAGYSAGVCVLAPSLKGVEFIDDPNIQIDGYDATTIWEGYGLIDFYPIVHYKSDSIDSTQVDAQLTHIKSFDLPYKTLRDGDAIVIHN